MLFLRDYFQCECKSVSGHRFILSYILLCSIPFPSPYVTSPIQVRDDKFSNPGYLNISPVYFMNSTGSLDLSNPRPRAGIFNKSKIKR